MSAFDLLHKPIDLRGQQHRVAALEAFEENVKGFVGGFCATPPRCDWYQMPHSGNVYVLKISNEHKVVQLAIQAFVGRPSITVLANYQNRDLYNYNRSVVLDTRKPGQIHSLVMKQDGRNAPNHQAPLWIKPSEQKLGNMLKLALR